MWIKFFYIDSKGRASETSEDDYLDDARAIEVARVHLRDRNYRSAEIWAGSRLVAKVHAPLAAHPSA